MHPKRLLLIGDRDLAKPAHVGLEASVSRFNDTAAAKVDLRWIGTDELTPDTVERCFNGASAVWCSAGSPYASFEGALLGIQYARQASLPFLGTCGGFQHALIEFARNVAGQPTTHAELEPNSPDALIVKLSCSLAGGAKGKVISADGWFSSVMGAATSLEEFNCNYGAASGRCAALERDGLRFVAHDELGDVRAFRLTTHRFYVGTLFQPERRVLSSDIHPLVGALLECA
jgi:CTP synthase (UTP-ammonia lyase)